MLIALTLCLLLFLLVIEMHLTWVQWLARVMVQHAVEIHRLAADKTLLDRLVAEKTKEIRDQMVYFQKITEDLMRESYARYYPDQQRLPLGRRIEYLLGDLRPKMFCAVSDPMIRYEYVRHMLEPVRFDFSLSVAINEAVPPELIANQIANNFRSAILRYFQGQSILEKLRAENR